MKALSTVMLRGEFASQSQALEDGDADGSTDGGFDMDRQALTGKVAGSSRETDAGWPTDHG